MSRGAPPPGAGRRAPGAGRRARISALAEFADAAWGVLDRPFVDLLLSGIAWSVLGREATKTLDAVAAEAWQTFERERRQADADEEASWDDEFESAVMKYVGEIMSLAAGAAEQYRHADARVPRTETLMKFAVRLYLEVAGSCPHEIAANLLVDLYHWCADCGVQMSRPVWFPESVPARQG